MQVLPLIGELLSHTTSGLIIFTFLLTLKLANVINWPYWAICGPLWLVLFILLVLTQSKRLIEQTSLILRLAWLLCICSIVSFLVLLNMRLEDIEQRIGFNYIFLPLWILIGVLTLLAFSGLIVGLCWDDKNEKRRKKYLLAGLPLLIMVLVMFPFIFLLEWKIENNERADYGWSVVFIPIWITDAFFLCVSCVLLLFTVGARQSAVFSMSQVITFLCILTTATIFTVLLVMALEGHEAFSYFVVMAPLFLLEFLCVACGINIRFGKKKQSKDQFRKNRSIDNEAPK